MELTPASIALSVALALTACGDRGDTPRTDAAPTAATPTEIPEPSSAAPAGEPATTPAAPASASPEAAAAATSDKPAAQVTNCATEIEGNDAMQFNVGSITVPSSCRELTITLTHTGKLPVAAMGHNVVVSSAADMPGVAADGIGAGPAESYVKPGDTRVIAKSDLIGGGQTTTVRVPVSRLQSGGPYMFFCSFPGHSALMKGTLNVQ